MTRLDDLPGLIYTGTAPSDPGLLSALPEELRGRLRETNGVVAFRGGLHVRGAVDGPKWHSLAAAWRGEEAFHHHYRSLTPDDIPFAEDALGDQFFLRGAEVWKLMSETDDANQISASLDGFLASCEADPVAFLLLEPLLRVEQDDGPLKPGQLINAYPPFCTSQAADGVSLRAIPAEEQLSFLRHISATFRDLPDGASVDFKVVD
jgi:hypothetical protein